MSDNRKIRVGITHGDINGIGYEVILRTLADPIHELCTPVVYGSSTIATYYRKGMELEPVNFKLIANAAQIVDGHSNLIEVLAPIVKAEPGVESSAAGEAAFTALERAVADLKAGYIDVLVTAPINKKTIQSEQFHFPGHTEYLAASIGEGAEPMMILFNDEVKVALVTIHKPIAEVAASITKEGIVAKLEQLDRSLRYDFGLERPRIAVLGLNPHAGDGGLLGKEEQEVIAPAISEACDTKHLLCFGPYAADGFFGSRQYRHFDAVLAMYHDQGLAPFKTIAGGSGVNFTAGLPFVRTSPDHGTGFDIANKGLADHTSMREAIYKAIDILRCRRAYESDHRNPLTKQYFDKGKDNVVLDLTKVEDPDL